jgi:hypothetical protein
LFQELACAYQQLTQPNFVEGQVVLSYAQAINLKDPERKQAKSND